MYEFTSQEEEWINSTEDSALAQLCVQFAAGLNRLDFSLIEPLLALDCTYGSQSVFDVLKGYEQVAEYWSGKLDPLSDAALSLATALIVGFFANDMRRLVLERRGDSNEGVVLGDNEDGALERFLANSPVMMGVFRA